MLRADRSLSSTGSVEAAPRAAIARAITDFTRGRR
jgi:hypothetical protein